MSTINKSNKEYVKRKIYQELGLEFLRDCGWCVCVCVCVFVCLCKCVCVCLYSSTCWFLPAAPRLWHVWEVRINNLLLWVLVGWFLPSSLYPISESIIFHLQIRKLQLTATGEKTNDIMLTFWKNDIYWYRI